MAILTKEQILGADDRRTADVEVPEWGGTVRVRALSGAERDSYEVALAGIRPDGTSRPNLVNVRARLVALSVVDEDGKRLFTDADAKALGDKSAAAMQRVFETAQRLSALTDDDVEELVEGFVTAPSEASTSA
jgi:hypothetical protein